MIRITMDLLQRRGCTTAFSLWFGWHRCRQKKLSHWQGNCDWIRLFVIINAICKCKKMQDACQRFWPELLLSAAVKEKHFWDWQYLQELLFSFWQGAVTLCCYLHHNTTSFLPSLMWSSGVSCPDVNLSIQQEHPLCTRGESPIQYALRIWF